jgi:hypothetical protein
MGLKGCRLWVMGQLDSTCRAPPRGFPLRQRARRAEARDVQHVLRTRAVALQVEFERQILKPVFHLIGFRLWV